MCYNTTIYELIPHGVKTAGIVRHDEVNTMSTPKDIVFIYVLQRISDKAYLYIGSAKNPKYRFAEHKIENRYSTIREAFSKNDIRFLVITSTDEAHRLDKEHDLWRQFIEAGHPIVNVDPALTAWDYGKSPWNKGKRMSDELRIKLSEAHKGKRHSEETRRKMSETHKGKTKTEEVRRHMSEAQHHRPPISDETRQKISKANRGRPNPHVGRPRSEETQRKISEAYRRRKPLSEESHRNLSEAAKLRWAKRKQQEMKDV